MGKFGLGIQNEAGQRLIEFCQKNIPGDTSLSADPTAVPFMEVMSELFGVLQLS